MTAGPAGYDAVFAAIYLAADKYEKEFGKLTKGSDFFRYGKALELAVIQFNQVNSTSYDPDLILSMWNAEGEKEADPDMTNMNEALKSWDTLKG